MKFIYVFDNDLKNELLNSGYNLLRESNGLFIFDNNNMTFNFNEKEKSKYYFTNKLII